MAGKTLQKKPKKYTDNKKFVNLGCGDDYRKSEDKIEWINIDVNKKIRADIHIDFLSKGIPLKDNSVDEVFCKNLFEHVPNPLSFLLEIKRILKKSGTATIITSNASYLIYHFPRKKAYHDSYNLNHPIEDQHYFLFQKGHLIAFTRKAGMKLNKLDYYISNMNPGRDRIFQKILGFILSRKFGYSDFLWVVEKE